MPLLEGISVRFQLIVQHYFLIFLNECCCLGENHEWISSNNLEGEKTEWDFIMIRQQKH